MDDTLQYWARIYANDTNDAGAAGAYGRALQRSAGNPRPCELVYR